MDLPIRYLKFITVDAFRLFIRLWRNIIATVEEDLAVTLMMRLLFVPLFHDASFVGRCLSIVFRLSRIFLGLFAYLIVTVVILMIALTWFISPLFLFSLGLQIITPVVFFLSLLLFTLRIISRPAKTVNQTNSPSQIWQATLLHPADLTWTKLIKQSVVQDLIFRLELPPEEISALNLTLDQATYDKTYELAKIVGTDYIFPNHFFVAALLRYPEINHLLLKHKLKLDDLLWVLNFQLLQHQRATPAWIWSDNYRVRHLKGVNRGWLAAPTPALDQVSTDLTARAAYEPTYEFVGRFDQLKEVIETLSSPTNRNVLVVGPAGSGKTTLAKFLANLILQGDAPPSLATKRLVQLDLTKLLSGVQTQGDLAQRVKNFFNEVLYFQNIIVFVDQIENMGFGSINSDFNLLALIEPYLDNTQIQFLATTQPDSYNQIINRHNDFARLFHRIDLPPATEDETTQFLIDQTVDLEQHSLTKFTLIALRSISHLSHKHIHDRVLPDSALQLWHHCLETQQRTITSHQVRELLSQDTHAPLVDVSSDEKAELLHLEDQIHTRLIDQVEAVKAVVTSLKRSAAQLNEGNRPVGSFLFVGPTGVGKTELAKLLAELYYHHQGAFIRLDMSEYQTESSIDRLIGNPSKPGELTEAIQHQPYTLLLLDEFEKADPKILTLFLQVLEDGRLTDYSGKTVSFVDSIIIATSNAASLTIAQGLEQGKTIDQIKDQVRSELVQIYKPELINRFDDVIIFKPLQQSELEQIVKIKLTDLQNRLTEQGYLIDFSPDLISELAKQGYDPVLGARPLRRLIQDTLEAKLSDLILSNQLQPGQQLTLSAELLKNP